MPLDMRMLENRIWLMDEGDLRRKLNHLALFKECYSGREVAKFNRKRLEEARGIVASGGARPAPKGDLIAVLPVFGAIDQRMSSAMMKSGGTSCEEISAMLDACLDDAKVSTVVMQFDSGGGSSSGIQELSDKIFDMRQEKKMYAISDSFCASAAYWLASACETLVCTPSGEVGSIGAYVVHADESQALENEGVKITLIKAGKYKAEMAPFHPLTPEAKDHVQEQVDEVYGKFLKAVARNRATTVADVRAHFGEGRMMSAEKALKVGAIDRILSMEELIGKLTSGRSEEAGPQRKRAESVPSVSQQGPSVEVLRQRHKLLQRAAHTEGS